MITTISSSGKHAVASTELAELTARALEELEAAAAAVVVELVVKLVVEVGEVAVGVVGVTGEGKALPRSSNLMRVFLPREAKAPLPFHLLLPGNTVVVSKREKEEGALGRRREHGGWGGR